MQASKESTIVEKLFKKYKLKIYNFRFDNYFNDDEYFPNEQNCQEVRVELGKLLDMDWLLDWHGFDNIEDLKNHYAKDNKKDRDRKVKDFENDLKKIKDETSVEIGPNLEFSVFIKPDSDLTKDQIREHIHKSAYYYMSFLMNTMPQVYINKNLDYFDAYTKFTDEFKEVLKQICLNINNSNLELVQSISYRLYKDYKFFYQLREHLGKIKHEEFISDFEFIINNIDSVYIEEDGTLCILEL